MLTELSTLLGEALVLQDAERALALGDAHVRRRHKLAATLRCAHDARAADSHKNGVCLFGGQADQHVPETGDARQAQCVNGGGLAGRTSGFSHVCAQVRAAIARWCVTTRIRTGARGWRCTPATGRCHVPRARLGAWVLGAGACTEPRAGRRELCPIHLRLRTRTQSAAVGGAALCARPFVCQGLSGGEPARGQERAARRATGLW